FHLGEVLVSQAHIRAEGHEAYGLRRGHDLEAAMAMALVDLALLRGIRVSECTAFCAQAAAEQAQADRARLSRIEATRVNMETF
ncbi:MAG: phosphonate C-P lyase system protein PhnG, partial [Mangrovicoccus sp.]